MLDEYGLLMKAYALKQVDDMYAWHMQAWLNQQVQATKKQGKATVSHFKSFTDFFNKEEQERLILGEKKKDPQDKRMEMLKRANF